MRRYFTLGFLGVVLSAGALLLVVYLQATLCPAQPTHGDFRQCDGERRYTTANGEWSWCETASQTCLDQLSQHDSINGPNCYSSSFKCPNDTCGTPDNVCATFHVEPAKSSSYGYCSSSGTVPSGAVGKRCRYCDYFACLEGQMYDDQDACELAAPGTARCTAVYWEPGGGNCDPAHPYF